MTMTVGGNGDHARVASVTELHMTGRAAQMGRGVIEDVAGRLVREMADNLSAQLARSSAPPEAAAPAKPVNGLVLLWKALVARLFKKPT
jgi:hypothetical protein